MIRKTLIKKGGSEKKGHSFFLKVRNEGLILKLSFLALPVLKKVDGLTKETGFLC